MNFTFKGTFAGLSRVWSQIQFNYGFLEWLYLVNVISVFKTSLTFDSWVSSDFIQPRIISLDIKMTFCQIIFP